MATVIQLFNDEDTTLSSGYLDVSDNIPVPITYSVADVKVIGNRTASSTKSVILPGTKNNNQLFGQLFDVNIEFGLATYNIYKKQKCAIIIDNRIVLDNAYIQLVSVTKKNNIQTSEDEILYEVIIKSQIFDFFTQIQNMDLQDLDFSEFNHEFSAQQINSAFENTWVDGYKYIMPYTTGTTYNINQLKPSIYAKQYWDKIHENAGYTYEWDTLSDVKFDDMLIASNDNDIRISDYINERYSARANNTSIVDEFIVVVENSGDFGIYEKKIRYNVEFDPDNRFDLAIDSWTNPFTYPEKLRIVANLNYDLFMENLEFDVAYVSSTGDNYIKTYFVIKDNSDDSDISVTEIGNYVFENGSTFLLDYETAYLRTYWSNLPIPSTNPVQVTVELDNLPLNTSLSFYIRYDIQLDVRGDTLDVVDIRYTNHITNSTVDVENDFTPDISITYASENVPFGFEYPINTIIPNKFKQRDFVDNIIKMFNLYVEPSKENDRKLVYKRRDDFYDQGKILNWSNKLMQNMDQKVEFLSDLNFKNLVLTYKSDSDGANKAYTDATKQIFGQTTVIFDTEWLKNTETVSLTFSPTPIGVSGWFAPTPYINYSENFNPRILIDNYNVFSQYNSSEFIIFNYFITTPVIDFSFLRITSYPIITTFYGNVETIVGNPPTYTVNYDINFGQTQYNFFNSQFRFNPTDNNLYNLNYKRTYQQLNSSRLLTAYFDLNEVDIATLSLADKVWCMNKYWLINTIVDYDANANKPTQVELISYEDESIVFFPD